MRPTTAALMLGIAALGRCNNQETAACPESAFSVHPFEPTPCHSGSSEHVPVGSTGSTATGHSQVPGPQHTVPTNSSTDTGAASPTGAGITTNRTSSLGPWTGARKGPLGLFSAASETSKGEKEIHRDEHGNPFPMRFGMQALVTLLDALPRDKFYWPYLPDAGNPVTRSPDEFKDVHCTGEYIDPFEERRASRHLHYFCNRFQVPHKSLYATTSGKATLYMCSYKKDYNCSLDLWRAASRQLDRRCGPGGSGFLYLDKMRIGRDRPHENVVYCPEVHYSPLVEYSIAQRDPLVDGRPWEEWRILNRRKQMREELVPRDINEANNDDP